MRFALQERICDDVSRSSSGRSAMKEGFGALDVFDGPRGHVAPLELFERAARGTFHEPECKKASSPRPSPPEEEREKTPARAGFMVTMRAKNRKEAFHKPKARSLISKDL